MEANGQYSYGNFIKQCDREVAAICGVSLGSADCRAPFRGLPVLGVKQRAPPPQPRQSYFQVSGEYYLPAGARGGTYAVGLSRGSAAAWHAPVPYSDSQHQRPQVHACMTWKVHL